METDKEKIKIYEKIFLSLKTFSENLNRFEKNIYKIEQKSEEKQASKFFDSFKTPKVDDKEEKTEVKKPSFISSLQSGFIALVLAFLPPLIKLIRDNKKFISEFPSKVYKWFFDLLNNIKENITDNFITPLKKFLMIDLLSTWDALKLQLTDQFEKLMFMPVSILNASKQGLLNLKIDIYETVKNFFVDSTVAKYLGFGQKEIDKIDSKISKFKEELATLQEEQKIREDSIKALDEKTFEEKKQEARAERIEEYKQIPSEKKIDAERQDFKVSNKNQQLVVDELIAAGVTDPEAIANILAQIQRESKFQPKSESLYYKSPDRLRQIFPTFFVKQGYNAEEYVGNPEKLANLVYGPLNKQGLGNTGPDDGFKYIGRGFIQITGKHAYKSLSDYTGIDLLNNPDLLNTPEVAAKSIPWFFLVYKGKTAEELKNLTAVNKAMGNIVGQFKTETESYAQTFLKDLKENKSSVPVPSASIAGNEIQKNTTDLGSKQKPRKKRIINEISSAEKTPSPIKSSTDLKGESKSKPNAKNLYVAALSAS